MQSADKIPTLAIAAIFWIGGAGGTAMLVFQAYGLEGLTRTLAPIGAVTYAGGMAVLAWRAACGLSRRSTGTPAWWR